MISNVLLGTDDLAKAERFYNELLTHFEAQLCQRTDRAILWKAKAFPVGIAVCIPHNGKAASNGNGNMIGLKADSRSMVDEIYATALALGGTCDGKPGERKQGVYAAYFRDLDKHKFGVFYLG
ncbi:glyoxalase [Shewanella sp. OPT22]|nr:glyoxalase [Shewanella sp. OPT22]